MWHPGGMGVPTGTRVTVCDDVSMPPSETTVDSQTMIIVCCGAGAGGVGAGSGNVAETGVGSFTAGGSDAVVEVLVGAVLGEASTFRPVAGDSGVAPEEETTNAAMPSATTGASTTNPLSRQREAPAWFPATGRPWCQHMWPLSTGVVDVATCR